MSDLTAKERSKLIDLLNEDIEHYEKLSDERGVPYVLINHYDACIRRNEAIRDKLRKPRETLR